MSGFKAPPPQNIVPLNGFAPFAANGGGGEPTTRLVADLNGLSQWVVVPSVSMTAGDTISGTFNVASNTSNGSGVFAIYNSTTDTIVRFVSFSSIGDAAVQVLTGGTQTFYYQFPFIFGEDIIITATQGAGITINGIGIGGNLAGIDYSGELILMVNIDPADNLPFSPSTGVARDVTVKDRFYPIDDGFSVNPVIANSNDLSGATDGAAINFTEATWVEVPIPAAPVNREVADLNGLSQYISIPSVTATSSDFNFSCDIVPINTSAKLIFSGQSSGDRFYLGIQNRKVLIGNGTDRVVSTTVLPSNAFSTLEFNVTAGVVTVTANGVVEYTNALIATLPKSFNNIFADNTGGFIVGGLVKNVVINGAGIQSRDYAIDDGFTVNPVIANKADLSGLTDGTAINFTAATWKEVPK